MSRPCPSCDSETSIFNTRYKKRKDVVWRRYQCLNDKCGRRFTSYEILANQMTKRKTPISLLGFTVTPVIPREYRTDYWIQKDDGEGMGISRKDLKAFLEAGWNRIF
jgi:hypothetical protein